MRGRAGPGRSVTIIRRPEKHPSGIAYRRNRSSQPHTEIIMLATDGFSTAC